MKKTLFATTLVVAIAMSTTVSQAFTWSSFNPATWGQSSKCGCEKVCQKETCGCKPKCKKEKCNKCKPKCDPCQRKVECDPCKKSMQPSSPCAVPDEPCNACDRLQQSTER